MRQMNKTTLDIIVNTINEMPDRFTSREFNAAAVINGYPERMRKGKGLAPLIARFAKNDYYRSKTWTKLTAPEFTNVKTNQQTQLNECSCNLSLEKAIELIKKNGLKVMKPVADWVEC